MEMGVHLVEHQALELERAAIDGNFYKGKSSVAVTPGSPWCSAARRQPSFPIGRLLLDRRSL